MATTNQAAENQRTGWGYTGAILISVLGHAALGILLLVVLPAYVHAPQNELPSYTVKIVDNIPAGDLGSHLPRLSRHPPSSPQEVKPRPRIEEPPKVVVKPPPAPPPDNDKNAIALNSVRSAAPTPTPTPRPAPTVAATPAPSPKPAPTRAVSHHPTPKPTVRAHETPRPKPTPAVAIAKAESTPGVKQRLDKIREQLLAEHLNQVKKAPPDEGADDSDNGDEQADTSGGGPVVAKAATEGKGLGIGPGEGSAGIQQDLDFLLYYRSVQERIKQAWSFSGGNSELTTKVVFAIGADGKLTNVKITQGSHDSSFDDSVIRAIRRAAPFPVPPDKYRDQFVKGIEAVFKLGELNS